MSPSVLLLTQAGDTHAYAVAIALRELGARPLLWHTSDFPSRVTESVLLGVDGEERIVLGDIGQISEQDISSVWRRRPTYVLDRDLLHPADQQFADWQCMLFRSSLFDVLLPGAFWVNRPEAALRAGRKILQHKLALRAGLLVPETLYSNDASAIREFLRRHDNEVVYKTFYSATWQDEETHWLTYTSQVSEKDLVSDELLRATPGIFQTIVPKAYELRVTFIGNRPFAAKIRSQETVGGKMDWRKSYDELKMEPYEFSPSVAKRCWKLMRALGIVFGCFDFIVTPQGDHVFLEVNEMGQFLFVEHLTGMPLLDAFCAFLMAGSSDFHWGAEKVRIRYGDVITETLAVAEASASDHVLAPDTTVKEVPSL